MSLTQIRFVPRPARTRTPRKPAAVREAVEEIKAEHRVSETSAYAMLVREAIGVEALPPTVQSLPRQRRPLAS
jgi:hypothetical protein